MTELETLQEAGIDALRRQRPADPTDDPPLLFMMAPLVDWIEERHIEIIREIGFPEARRAFNPVFVHLPADGCRLTELAARAGMSKQAMAELVEELAALGYLARFPDPADGRAKLILRSEKGLKAHAATLAAFAQIDRELAERFGPDTVTALRAALARTAEA